MDYHELRVMTIAQLREVAEGLQDLTGYTQMNKVTLLAAICEHEGIATHEHHDVIGIDKAAIKQQIRELKSQRAATLESGERKEYKRVIRQIHRLKGQLRRATA